MRTRRWSLSLRRAWIEIFGPFGRTLALAGRSPYGERGLKYIVFGEPPGRERRSPYGERGLKFEHRLLIAEPLGRSPYGERGLKYHRRPDGRRQAQSLSLRRAWIEISRWMSASTIRASSLSLRRAWIEMRSRLMGRMACRSSLSLRRAWIEIWIIFSPIIRPYVALLTESVD